MTTTTVSTADALWAAIKGAKPGDTVLLASGSYGSLALNSMNVASPGVTISPAPGAKPVFNNIEHSGSSGLHYGAGIEVYIADPTQHNAAYGIYAVNCHDITLSGVKVHGRPIKPAGGVGAFFRLCTGGMKVDGCEFYDLGVGVGHMDCADVAISNSDFHDLCTDGIDNAGATGWTITNNRFRDFYPTPDAHPDAIQFWGTPTNRSSGGTVSGNVIQRGVGHTVNPDGSPNAALLPPQGIFAQETDNLTITGNAMAGTMFNGISIGDGKTATISGNFVQAFVDMGSRIIVRDGSQDIAIGGNTISDKVVDLVQAGSAPDVRVSIGADNVSIAPAAVGDISAMTAWLAQKAGKPAPGPVVSPPVVSPPAPPAPDPEAVQIASLQAQLATAQQQASDAQARVTGLTTKLQVATDAQTQLAAKIAAAQAALGG